MIDQVLKNLMFKRNLKTAEVARLSGIPQTTLHHLVSGTSSHPRQDTINALLSFFKISEAQLFGHKSIQEISEEKPLGETLKGWKEIPFYSWDDVVNFAKSGKLTIQNGMGTTFTTADVDDKSFVVQLTDQSMYPQFPEKTEVIVNTIKKPSDRDMVVVYIKKHDKAYFRMIIFNGANQFIRPLHEDLLPIGIEQLHPNEDVIVGIFVEARIKK